MTDLADDDFPPDDPKPKKKLPPLTEADVHDACDQINSGGEKPTYKLIRELLGRGSYTTMHDFIQTWRPAEIAAVPAPPESLSKMSTSLIQAIWREAVQHGSAELLEERRRAKSELDDLREAICVVEVRETTCIAQFLETEAKLQATLTERDRAVQEIAQLREKLLRAQGEIHSYKQVIERLAGESSNIVNPEAAE